MALLSLIRKWHHRQGKSIRSIAKQTGLSRNTIRKYLAAGTIEPKYQRSHMTTKLSEYESTLITWLHSEQKKPRKDRKQVKQLHQALVNLGFTGSYGRVAAFVRQWRTSTQSQSKGAFVPLEFAPGEAFQFDWSEEWAVIGGARHKLQVAHIRLCYSRAFFIQSYRQQAHEMLFDAHIQGFKAFEGVPERGIYDNMKTVVDKIGKGKERVINKRFQALASYYMFEPDFCTVAAGWEKGQVERQVRDARHRIWQTLPTVNTLEELNQYLAAQCRQLWQSMKHPQFQQQTIQAIFIQEKESLMPLPPAFDSYIEHFKKVSSTSLITFERHRYSVPVVYVHQRVQLRVYHDKLIIIHDQQEIARHARVQVAHDNNSEPHTVYDWRHYLGIIERKPGALRNGAPFLELPDNLKKLQRHLMKKPGGGREMAQILALVLWYDEEYVLQAVNQAMLAGHYSKEVVVNYLQRLVEPPIKPEYVEVPDKLVLQHEPTTDTAKYDYLREPAL